MLYVCIYKHISHERNEWRMLFYLRRSLNHFPVRRARLHSRDCQSKILNERRRRDKKCSSHLMQNTISRQLFRIGTDESSTTSHIQPHRSKAHTNLSALFPRPRFPRASHCIEKYRRENFIVFTFIILSFSSLKWYLRGHIGMCDRYPAEPNEFTA